MGRGRTTTGMVIAMLLHRVKILGFVEEDDEDEDDNSDETVYKRGDYRLILQLLQVLEQGKLAKKLVDEAIDECSHIQNLREAILSYRLRVKGDAQQRDRGLNYLLRYFYLIAFANYLVETLTSRNLQRSASSSSNARRSGTPKPSSHLTFSRWLADRKEIAHLVNNRANLDFN